MGWKVRKVFRKYRVEVCWRVESGCFGVDTTAGRLVCARACAVRLNWVSKGSVAIFVNASAFLWFGVSVSRCSPRPCACLATRRGGGVMSLELSTETMTITTARFGNQITKTSTSTGETHARVQACSYSCATKNRQSIQMSHSDKQSKRRMNRRT